MALRQSGFAGTAKLHDLTAGGGVSCDICGNEVDSEVADAVALDCSFAQCDPESSCYHTHCLEKFLKSIKCERNRKIGFPCPRGCGKGTKFKDACRGKILKSHPVSIRSEANKKRRQADLDQMAQQQQTAARDKATRKKEEDVKPAVGGKGGKDKAGLKDKDKGKAARPATIKALNVANTALTISAPPKTQAQLQKEQLAAAAKNLKNQILARSCSTASSANSATTAAAAASKLVASTSGRLSTAGSVGKREVKTLDEYLAERGGSSSSVALERTSSVCSSAAAPAASAWGKSRASSASSLEASELAEAAAVTQPPPPAPVAAAAPPLLSEEAFPPPAAAPTLPAPALGSGSMAGPGKPPRPPALAPALAAAAAAAAGVAAPAATQPQGAWAQKQSVAVAMAAAPPPPPPRSAGPTPPAPAASSLKGKGTAASVAAAAAAAAEDSRMSRTQRKNQRRAEKKAANASASGAAAAASLSDAGCSTPTDSQPTSPLARDAAAGVSGLAAQGYSDSFERCMQCLVQHKLQRQVEQLQQLGFSGGAAAAAVQQHGGNLEAALVVLIEQATGVQDSMHGLGLAASPRPAEVDLSEELQELQDLQVRYGLPPGGVEVLAVEHQGDLDSLAASLAAQQHSSSVAAYSAAHSQQQQQPQAQQQQQQQVSSFGDTLGGGSGLGGLFGSLAPPADSSQSYSVDSWGTNTFSAFGFGGFTEAAVHAVHGGGLPAAEQHGGSLLGGGGMAASSLGGSPTSHSLHSSVLGTSIWGSNPAALATTAGSGGAGYGSDAHMLTLLGVAEASAVSSSSGSGFGLLGAFDPLQPSSSQSIFDSNPQQQQYLAHQQPVRAGGDSGWHSGDAFGTGSGLQHQQAGLAALPLWGTGLGTGRGGGGDELPVLVR
ncbi:hypothetical protein D9Q98_005135 [Chlorella vulgaris]|uniref:UBA domain-containing protein n=1 Tax=Chlorella vulgaris TaxID=3077 RepID=A0A9D4YWV2_CHLVU|nr:hypothetical protein D9Q98_005135 [Chlorella vulgaris]